MRRFFLRTTTALAVSAVSVLSALAFAAPGTASAACSGANIIGRGSTLQELAQNSVWRPAFNAKCSGTEQVSEYKGIGSGAGLATWGVGKKEHNFGPEFAFVGTDQPPNATQKKEIEENTGGGVVLSIPTLQAAVSIDMHLPTGCTEAKSAFKGAKTRLVLNQTTVEGIFSRKIKKWNEIKDDGDELLPSGCAGETEITRVVRKEGSGTTAITKKFFYEINKGVVDAENGENWNELAEKNKNLEWPEEKVDLVRAEGGKNVAKTAGETPGAIGYANLADARATKLFTPEGGGGEKTAVFWAEVQNAPGKKKYTDPSTDGPSNSLANSNCALEKYVDANAEGKKAKFPPESTEDVWNEVTAELKQKNYAMCGFTYDLSLTKFSTTSSEKAGTTGAEEETIKDYFEYILTQGQTEIGSNHDYLGLPSSGSSKGNVLDIAKAGEEKISF